MNPHADADRPVLYQRTDGVATITLNRPSAMNALDTVTKQALRDTVEQAGADDGVRCVVLTGAGRAFCVGQDLREHAQALAERPLHEVWSTVHEHYAPTVLALATMAKPVIAAVNGVAAGAGAALAFGCDLRLLAETAGFNLAFTGIGLSCDTGTSWTLARLVGRAKATELLLLPTTIDAQESKQLALATAVVPAGELAGEAAALAHRLADGPTVAYGAVKRALAFSAAHPLEESMAYEGELMAMTGATSDHREAVKAFLAKQPPAFQGR